MSTRGIAREEHSVQSHL